MLLLFISLDNMLGEVVEHNNDHGGKGYGLPQQSLCIAPIIEQYGLNLVCALIRRAHGTVGKLHIDAEY